MATAASNRESCRDNEERDGLQNVEEILARYANMQIHGGGDGDGEERRASALAKRADLVGCSMT